MNILRRTGAYAGAVGVAAAALVAVAGQATAAPANPDITTAAAPCGVPAEPPPGFYVADSNGTCVAYYNNTSNRAVEIHVDYTNAKPGLLCIPGNTNRNLGLDSAVQNAYYTGKLC